VLDDAATSLALTMPSLDELVEHLLELLAVPLARVACRALDFVVADDPLAALARREPSLELSCDQLLGASHERHVLAQREQEVGEVLGRLALERLLVEDLARRRVHDELDALLSCSWRVSLPPPALGPVRACQHS
jgi:hypothetical protein